MTSDNSHSNAGGVANADPYVRVASSRHAAPRKHLAGTSRETRKDGNSPSTVRTALAVADSVGFRRQIAPAGRRTPGRRNQGSSFVAAQSAPSASVAPAAPAEPPGRCNRSRNISRRKQSRSKIAQAGTRCSRPPKARIRPCRCAILLAGRPRRVLSGMADAEIPQSEQALAS